MDGRLQIGAPGIYERQDEPVRKLTGERMDVCAFAGVAPRGRARIPEFRLQRIEARGPAQKSPRTVPVVIESWTEYVREFGAFEGPGLLPYAVASFFENGGQRAYVSRIVHEYAATDTRLSDDIARSEISGLHLRGDQRLTLRARNEGPWGNLLSAQLRFDTRTLTLAPTAAAPRSIALHAREQLEQGALLRLKQADGRSELRYVSAIRTEWDGELGVRIQRADLESALWPPAVSAEVVEATLKIDDGAGRREIFDRLGASSDHPRWLARVLIERSSLLYPDERPEHDWTDGTLEVPIELGSFVSKCFCGGGAHYEDITPEDFFSAWTPQDEQPGDGIHAIAHLSEVALLCVPDLYSPGPLAPVDTRSDESGGSDHFAACVPLPTPLKAAPNPGLTGLRLDPARDLDRIIDLQQRLVQFCDQLRSCITLLDVPSGLSQASIVRWRSKFTSAFAAAYHPWLDVSRSDDQRDALIRVNPSAIAAGIIAKRERDVGIAFGPGNVIAIGAIRVAERVSPARHDELHPLGINVYTQDRDGLVLRAARTLSLDPSFRQLSVRRLITMLERALERQLQWTVFEPNNIALRRGLTQSLRLFLRRFFEAGALQGNREEDAFFVRCDDTLNPARISDLGQLIAEVGVAPAEPLEFIVLNIQRDGDGTLRIGAQ